MSGKVSEVLGVPESPLAKLKREREEIATRMVAEAKTSPEVRELTDRLMSKTTKWGNSVGIIAEASEQKEMSPKTKSALRILEAQYQQGNIFSNNQVYYLKTVIEALTGESMPSEIIQKESSSSDIDLENGIVVMQIKANNDNKYPLNTPVFIVDADA